MTKTRREKKERMPKKPKVNLSASGSNGGGKCTICARPRHGSSKLCRRCGIRSRTDMTRFFARRSSLTYCPGCSSYLLPPSKWVRAEPNSAKLLTICIRLLSKPLPRPIYILKTQFIESSDHGIIKIRLHLRGEISQGVVSDRHHLAEFTVRRKICESCGRSSSGSQPRVTRVELRQRHPKRRFTLSDLEEAISKHGAAPSAVRIQEHDLGTDFIFSDRSHALDLVRFVEEDTAISDSLLGSRGNLGPLVMCTKVAAHGISLMDPFTPQAAFLTAEDYWRAPFRVMLHTHHLVEYLVLDITMITPDPRPSKEASDDSHCMAHVHIICVLDLGKKDGRNKMVVRTHLGRLLKPGDYVLGYYVGGAAGGGPETEVVLVRKVHGAKKSKRRKKKNKRSSSSGERSTEELMSFDNDYEGLLRDLENARVGLSNASPHQISKECQMLPMSSDDIPSIPVGKWLGDERAADNTIMDWLPSTQLSSRRSSFEPSPGGYPAEEKLKTKLVN